MSTAIAAPRAATRNTMSRILDNSDVAIAVVVVGIVVMMIVPLPPWLLDILLTANISAALAIVLATLYTTEPLQFSVFPSLLLVATLFRLALNISATRLILLHGEAGEVISSFGAFVVGGNVVVGLIVFMILIVMQFVVITNGAGRVAEVAARFTLDAMPGKQMAIDADLNAGVITDEEATQAPRDHRQGGRLLRRHGRRVQVREGRRDRGGPDRRSSTSSAASASASSSRG